VLVSSIMSHVSSLQYQVSGLTLQVSGLKSQVSGSWFVVSWWYRRQTMSGASAPDWSVAGTVLYLVSSVLCLVLVSGVWFLYIDLVSRVRLFLYLVSVI
jgi:hypothetical protein